MRLAIGLAEAALAAASLVLTPWLDLHPCHLCIFQRLLFMVIALLGITAALSGSYYRLAGGPIVPLATIGTGTAGYQSWLQAQSVGALSCVGG